MNKLTKAGTTGIILCGGKNSRMGKNKALLKLGNQTIIEHIVESLQAICSEILLSTNTNELDFLPYQKVADKTNNLGPIAGFESTLTKSETAHNLIVSCDTPFVSAELLSYLLQLSQNYDVVLPSFNNHLQPMIGYFNKNVLKIIEQQVNKGNRKPINIFENANMLEVEITEELNFYNKHLFFNINTKEEYEEAKRIYQSISK